MAGRYCSSCGRPLSGVGTFCPSCGAAVPAGAPPSGGPTASGANARSPDAFFPPTVGPGGTSDAARAADRTALSRVSVAAILTIVGTVLGLAVSAFANIGRLTSVSTGGSGVVLHLPPAWVWAVVFGFDAVLGLAGLVFLCSAFRALRPFDSRFSAPAALAVVAMVGVVLLLVGAGVLIDSLYSAAQCAGAGAPVTRACLISATFWGGLALVGVGLLLAVVGWIGVLLGLWRLGSRYNESLFKIGAVLQIIPIANVIGAILILIGARTHRP